MPTNILGCARLSLSPTRGSITILNTNNAHVKTRGARESQLVMDDNDIQHLMLGKG